MQLNQLAVTGQMAKATRHNRTPNFPIAGAMNPYGLYPLWAHPVLPGETMQSMSTKMRMVSMPVKHPLAGCWLETWLFYVKFTDIDPDLGQMFVSDSYSETGWTAATNRARFFTKAGQINWIEKAVQRIHEAYFMNGNETARTIDSVPKVKLNNKSWYENMIFEPVDEAVPTTDASDMQQHLNSYMMLQQMSMTELTYEKYLETFGAHPTKASLGEPEILRFSRSWTQPVNAIDPTDGTPSSAWVWTDDVKSDKPKRFEEPGFILMLACARPKMFQKHVKYSLIGNMWGFSDWYPSYNLQDPSAGVKQIDTSDAVFHADHRTDVGDKNMIYDHKDLLSHGEQFVNDTTGTPYPLPYSTGMLAEDASEPEDLRGEYPADADIDALFVGTTPKIYYEGMAFTVISGHVTDTTR